MTLVAVKLIPFFFFNPAPPHPALWSANDLSLLTLNPHHGRPCFHGIPVRITGPLEINRAMATLRIWMRRTVAKYGARAKHVAAARIQRAWLRGARNRWLRERVGRVFAMARAGDVDGMMRELRANPDVLFMRDRCWESVVIGFCVF